MFVNKRGIACHDSLKNYKGLHVGITMMIGISQSQLKIRESYT